jgi:hypothetical protein
VGSGGAPAFATNVIYRGVGVALVIRRISGSTLVVSGSGRPHFVAVIAVAVAAAEIVALFLLCAQSEVTFAAKLFVAKDFVCLLNALELVSLHSPQRFILDLVRVGLQHKLPVSRPDRGKRSISRNAQDGVGIRWRAS